jgi:hypothetical protein
MLRLQSHAFDGSTRTSSCYGVHLSVASVCHYGCCNMHLFFRSTAQHRCLAGHTRQIQQLVVLHTLQRRPIHPWPAANAHIASLLGVGWSECCQIHMIRSAAYMCRRHGSQLRAAMQRMCMCLFKRVIPQHDANRRVACIWSCTCIMHILWTVQLCRVLPQHNSY